MGKNDANNLFNLAIGAVVGVLIYTAYSNHLRSYAAEATAIDCDAPRPWSRRERARYEAMTSTQQRRYLVTREQEFQRLCRETAQEINSDQLAGTPSEQNL